MIFPSSSETDTQIIELNTFQNDIQKSTKMPPQPSIKFIEDLSSRDTEKLAKVLSLGWRTKISLQWLSEQNAVIKQLPSTLRKSDGIFFKVAMSLPRAPQRAVLCNSHRGLNPLLIRRFFIQLSAECTIRLARLDESSHHLPPNVAAFLKRIHRINSLWFAPGVHRSMFNLPHEEKCHGMIEGGCEACILSVVGTSHEMLRDLRASMLGRRKKGLPVPRLLKIIEAWVEGTEHGIAIRKDSDTLEKEVRGCRRQLQKARRQKRRNLKEGIFDTAPEAPPLLKEPPEEEIAQEDNFPVDSKEKDEAAEHYFGTSILDYYTGGLRSSIQSRAPTPIPKPEDVHPAFRSGIRDSMMAFDPSTGTFKRRGSEPSLPSKANADRDSWETDMRESRAPSRARSRAAPLPPPRRPGTAYSASVYSRNQFGDPATVPSSIPDVPLIPDTYACDQAKAYNKMMGIEEEDEESDRHSRNSRVSKWMNGQ